ncbi:MAG: hypothetical protein AB1589_28425 [Cyanobacteriota bacterium]
MLITTDNFAKKKDSDNKALEKAIATAFLFTPYHQNLAFDKDDPAKV